MDISDEAKRQALEAAKGVKDAAGAQALWPKAETTQEMETGSPQTPGYEANYGQTMKSPPQWPEAKAPEPSKEQERQPNNDIDR